MSHPQVVEYNGERWFVCDYTGQLVRGRYYVPEGGEKRGCFATLPILLRALVENGAEPEEFGEIKETLLDHFNQPDIPVQPALARKPLGHNCDLATYLSELEQGQSWMLVEGKELASEYEPPVEGKRKRAAFVEPRETEKARTFSLPQGVYLLEQSRVRNMAEVPQIVRKWAEIERSQGGFTVEAKPGVFVVARRSAGTGDGNPLVRALVGVEVTGEALCIITKKTQIEETKSE